METFPDRCKKLRKESKLTLEQMCYRINKKYGTSLNKGLVSRWEHGTAIPDTRNLIAVTNFFNVSMEYLLGISDEMNLPKTATDKDLSRKEKKMIDAYREASEDTQRAVDAILRV